MIFLKNENEAFLDFYSFHGFLIQFPNIISKTSNLYILHFKHYNLAIYGVNFFEKNPYITSIAKVKSYG
jgi:hypothetical protein